MAIVCRHWRISPADYWAMSWADRCALVENMNEEAKERKKEAQRAKTRSRRRR